MKLIVLQENLAKGLSLVNRAVNTRSTLPVLGNVLVSTDKGRLKLSATNLEIAVTCWLGAKVEREGATTVPARMFSDLVGSLPQETVNLDLDNDSQMLHIECGRTEANLNGISAEEFPQVPDADVEGAVRIRAGGFKEMISQVAFAVALDDTRPVLTGVLMEFSPGHLKMAATDAFRLSVRTASIEYDGEPVSIVVPARALNEVARAISNDDELLNIVLTPGRNQAIFVLDNVVVVSQLIEGTFPDFSPIIPTGYKTKAVVDTAAFLKACRTASIFARESSHTARVAFDPGDGTLGHASISANSAELGDNVAQVDANIEGEHLEIGFNVKYLTDILNVLDAPQTVIETGAATDPGVIRQVGDPDFFHIIMPMHVGR